MRPIALPDLSSCLEPLPLPQGRGQNQQAMHTLNRRTTKCLLANLAALAVPLTFDLAVRVCRSAMRSGGIRDPGGGFCWANSRTLRSHE